MEQNHDTAVPGGISGNHSAVSAVSTLPASFSPSRRNQCCNCVVSILANQAPPLRLLTHYSIDLIDTSLYFGAFFWHYFQLVQLFFWLWNRKMISPFLIPPTKLWSVTFSPTIRNSCQWLLFKLLKKIWDEGNDSEVWRQYAFQIAWKHWEVYAVLVLHEFLCPPCFFVLMIFCLFHRFPQDCSLRGHWECRSNSKSVGVPLIWTFGGLDHHPNYPGAPLDPTSPPAFPPSFSSQCPLT